MNLRPLDPQVAPCVAPRLKACSLGPHSRVRRRARSRRWGPFGGRRCPRLREFAVPQTVDHLGTESYVPHRILSVGRSRRVRSLRAARVDYLFFVGPAHRAGDYSYTRSLRGARPAQCPQGRRPPTLPSAFSANLAERHEPVVVNVHGRRCHGHRDAALVEVCVIGALRGCQLGGDLFERCEERYGLRGSSPSHSGARRGKRGCCCSLVLQV